ncbi:MAG: DUF3667 domain-containing protein [Ahniella sp.]|nr:DUF3667 domain-containing protein [Ahniella sp.]
MSNELEAAAHCPVCQRSARKGRISLGFLWRRLVEEVVGDRRSLRVTFVDLMRRPGEVVQAYLGGEELRYFSPLKYFLMVLALSLLMPVPRVLDGMLANIVVQTGRFDLAQAESFIQDWNALLYLPMLLVLGLVTRYFYRAQGYNYAEHLVIAAYGWAQLSLLTVLGFLIANMTRDLPGIRMGSVLLFALTPVYWFWFCHRVFGQRGLPGLLRAFATLPCAVLLFLLLAAMVMAVIRQA